MPVMNREPTPEEMQYRAVMFKTLMRLDRNRFEFSTNVDVKNNAIEFEIKKLPLRVGRTYNRRIKMAIPVIEIASSYDVDRYIMTIVNNAIIEISTASVHDCENCTRPRGNECSDCRRH